MHRTHRTQHGIMARPLSTARLLASLGDDARADPQARRRRGGGRALLLPGLPGLPGVPGVREPLPRPRPDARQDLVAWIGKEQVVFQALPPGHGPLPRLRYLHEGLSHPEVRSTDRYGALR